MVPALKTVLLVTISTARLVFPGVPGARNAAPADQPPASKSISFELASDAIVGKDSVASIALPNGLKLGKSIDLQIDPAGAPKPDPEPPSKVSVYRYWGSGREVAAGQPEVGRPQDSAQDSVANMPTNSYASWPTMDSAELKDNAATPGEYALKTNYCGSTTFTLTPEQNFLSPINITSSAAKADLAKPIAVTWRPVPNAVGYLIRAYGGSDTRTVTWTSAAKPALAEEIEYRAVPKEEADKLVSDGVLLPSYAISATIPAGIFQGASSVMLVLTAFGKDTSQSQGGVDTQVVIRSAASFPLYSTPFVLPESKRKRAE